jgi:methionine-rich copper-binding protein CopC
VRLRLTGIRSGRVGSLAVAVVAVLVVVLAARVDAAPTRLAATVPADGATLTTAPGEVRLTFTGLVDPSVYHVEVATTGGVRVTDGAARLTGQTLVVPVRIEHPGMYLVGYHLVLGGGRELSGTSRFVVTSTGTGVPPPAAVPAPAPDSAAAHQHGVDPVSLAVLGADGVLIAFLLAVLLRRPRGDRTPRDASGTPAGRR